jgi:2-keto-4-pentenoate hydratase/2-oxohepta-3-ene-1,7-dioic acid hydratase in catechol pathway
VQLVSFDDRIPGLLRGGRVFDCSPVLEKYAGLAPDQRMPALIAEFEWLRPAIERLAAGSSGRPLADVWLCSPIPRPRKLLCELGDFSETIPEPKGATDFYLKSPESVIGPGGIVALPPVAAEPFRARGAIALVIGRPCRNVAATNAWDYILGFAPFIDIGAGAFGRPNIGTFFGNSFDGFGPLGPSIATRDEIADTGSMRVRLSLNERVIQDYRLAALHYAIPEQIEAASAIMTLHPGDLVISGKFLHDGPGLKAGDALALAVEGVGELRVRVGS